VEVNTSSHGVVTLSGTLGGEATTGEATTNEAVRLARNTEGVNTTQAGATTLRGTVGSESELKLESDPDRSRVTTDTQRPKPSASTSCRADGWTTDREGVTRVASQLTVRGAQSSGNPR
jgi:osmotically-inducible protein OsmY